MFPLAGDSETCLLERADGIEMIDAGELWHRSGDLDLPHFRILQELITDGQILGDCCSDVCERF